MVWPHPPPPGGTQMLFFVVFLRFFPLRFWFFFAFFVGFFLRRVFLRFMLRSPPPAHPRVASPPGGAQKTSGDHQPRFWPRPTPAVLDDDAADDLPAPAPPPAGRGPGGQRRWTLPRPSFAPTEGQKGVGRGCSCKEGNSVIYPTLKV